MNSHLPVIALNQLHALLGNSYKHYWEAAGRIHDPARSRFLLNLAVERQQLQEEVAHCMGGPTDILPAVEPSPTGILPVEEKSSAPGEEASLLQQCIRGENNLLQRYNDLLNDGHLAPDLCQKFSKQKDRVQAAIAEADHMKSVRG